MSESCGRRGKGRTSGMAIVNFAWTKVYRLLDDPNYQDQQN